MDLHNLRESVSVQDADMKTSSFVNAKLSGSRFDDVNLQDATFTNVNLRGAAYANVNLSGASIVNANLAGMTLDGVLVDDLLRAYRLRVTRAEGRAGAVVYAKNVARLQQFYRHVLGFTLVHEAGDHVVLTAPAFQLVLVGVPAAIASSIEVGDPPRLRVESPTKLTFVTTSIATVRALANGYGGAVLPSEKEWDFDGARVCDGSDPEGNVFQLREPLSRDTRASAV
jgi:catechol 2,3-dioxygenase-like lactoylglutathione lyase family enzyme